jgi:two-component system, response regulator
MSAPYILLVEDDADDEELTVMAIRRNQFRNDVIVVHDGVEALAYLDHTLRAESPPILPRLILLDLKLPRLDGLGVLEQLRANPRTNAIPVVVFSSSSEERDMIACYQRGANSYVRKPIGFEAFLKAIWQIGVYWLTLNEVPSAIS